MCRFASSLKIICNPKSIFTVLPQSLADTCRTKKICLSCLMPKFPAGMNKDTLCLLVSVLIGQKSIPSKVCMCHVFHIFLFWGFLWATVLFKTFSKHIAEEPSRWSLSISAGMCLTNTLMCSRSFAQAWVTLLLTVNLLLINQQYIFNTVSLKRNIHKTRLCTDWLNEMTRGSEEPNPTPEFPPRNNGSIFTTTAHTGTLWNM